MDNFKELLKRLKECVDTANKLQAVDLVDRIDTTLFGPLSDSEIGKFVIIITGKVKP